MKMDEKDIYRTILEADSKKFYYLNNIDFKSSFLCTDKKNKL